MQIRHAKEDEFKEVKNLILEYTNFLNRNLDFQGLDDELKDLKLKYSGEEGELLAAISNDDKIMGIVAYHKHNKERCEMKRLYVKPEYRNLKLGEKLISKIISYAKQKGYREMVLDTIKPLKAAIHLYQKFGFRECPPYYHNPMEDVVYMKLEL